VLNESATVTANSRNQYMNYFAPLFVGQNRPNESFNKIKREKKNALDCILSFIQHIRMRRTVYSFENFIEPQHAGHQGNKYKFKQPLSLSCTVYLQES
jgi:hypothetical protein